MLVVPLATLTVLNVRLIAALNDVHQKRRQMQSARQQHDNNVTSSKTRVKRITDKKKRRMIR